MQNRKLFQFHFSENVSGSNPAFFEFPAAADFIQNHWIFGSFSYFSQLAAGNWEQKNPYSGIMFRSYELIDLFRFAFSTTMAGRPVGFYLPADPHRSDSGILLISYFIFGGLFNFLRRMPSNSGTLVLDIRTSFGRMPPMHGRLPGTFSRFFDGNFSRSSISATSSQLAHRCNGSASIGRASAVYRFMAKQSLQPVRDRTSVGRGGLSDFHARRCGIFS